VALTPRIWVALCCLAVTGPFSPPSTTTNSGSHRGVVEPVVDEDFSHYHNTADLLANPRATFLPSEDLLVQQITLDSTVGFGASSHSMRYTYPDRTREGGSGTNGRCTSYTISRAVRTGDRRHVWVEAWLKFSTNFTIVAPAAWRCTSNPDLKLLFGGVSGGESRFNLLMQQAYWIWGYPGREDAVVLRSPQPARMYDGQWHRYRMEMKVSSAPGVADGIARLWIDDALRSDLHNVVVNRTGIWAVHLARNINQGPDHPQSIWWGRVRVWDVDPGW